MYKYDSIEMVQEVRNVVLDYFTDDHGISKRSPFMQPVVYHLDQVCVAMVRIALGWENQESLAYSDNLQSESLMGDPYQKPTDAVQMTLFDLGPYPHHEGATGEI